MSSTEGLSAASVTHHGDYVYLSGAKFHTGPSGVFVIDVSDPWKPEVKRVVQVRGVLLGTERQLASGGEWLYMLSGATDAAWGLHVFALDNPARPRRLGSMRLGRPAGDIAAHGQYIYVAASDLIILHITERRDPFYQPPTPIPAPTMTLDHGID
jgi:hypothetical protein